MCWRTSQQITQKTGLNKNELRWPEYKQLIKSFPFTVKNIEIVGGGEPLLFPQIILMIRELKKRHLIGSLITNAVVLNKKISRELVDSRWDSIRVSLNAGSAPVY